MAIISKKKKIYKVSDRLSQYIERYGRLSPIPIHYQDLHRYQTAVTLYDKAGNDTLWYSVYYQEHDAAAIHQSLKHIYALLRTDGDLTIMEHLYIDRVDLCSYGNTQPFRIRVVNRINDNFDYFYIKVADASRVYGLEMEDLLSPNRINYLVHGQTLIEEHIPGIPGDTFINKYLEDGHQNKIRLAKEFIKFNERCFIQLLGDMHSSNWVVNIIPDFDELNYRIRPIDFDQQSYEGRKNIYLPQFYKQNNPIIALGLGKISPESSQQYRAEEMSMIVHRIMLSPERIRELMTVMSQDEIAPIEHVRQLREELANHYNNPLYLKCTSMGEILMENLDTVLRKHAKKRFRFRE